MNSPFKMIVKFQDYLKIQFFLLIHYSIEKSIFLKQICCQIFYIDFFRLDDLFLYNIYPEQLIEILQEINILKL
jgi:hypothetical protein